MGHDYYYSDEHKAIYYGLNFAISGDVNLYNYDSNFIIVQQFARYEKHKHIYKHGIGNYYWIIVHQYDTILGPLDSLEYVSAREMYKVPKKLQLK